MTPDDVTIRAAAKGDMNAVEQIILEYQNRVYGLCLRMMRNPQDAMDASQEAFIKVYRALGSFQSGSSFSSWIYRVTMNTCLDLLRKRKSAQASSLDEMAQDGDFVTGETEGPERSLSRKLTAQEVADAIDRLPDDMRTVIVLRDVQGLSYEEVASTLVLNLNTVKSRISRARRALRNILTQKEELFQDLSV